MTLTTQRSSDHPTKARALNALAFSSRPTSRPAFTLIEMLVVVVIIVLMLGLVIAAVGSLTNNAAVRRTRLTLGALKGIAENLDVSYQTIIDHSVTPTLPVGMAATAVDSDIERFVYGAWSTFIPEIQSQLQALQKDVYNPGSMVTLVGKVYPSNFSVADGFGSPLRYRMFVPLADLSASTTDGDLPARTKGNPASSNPSDASARRDLALPYFASAGIDTVWGDSQPTVNAQAKDNLYSYDMN